MVQTPSSFRKRDDYATSRICSPDGAISVGNRRGAATRHLLTRLSAQGPNGPSRGKRLVLTPFRHLWHCLATSGKTLAHEGPPKDENEGLNPSNERGLRRQRTARSPGARGNCGSPCGPDSSIPARNRGLNFRAFSRGEPLPCGPGKERTRAQSAEQESTSFRTAGRRCARPATASLCKGRENPCASHPGTSGY